MISLLSYTSLPHNQTKEKLNESIDFFNIGGSLNLALNEKRAFFTSEQPERYNLR